MTNLTQTFAKAKNMTQPIKLTNNDNNNDNNNNNNRDSNKTNLGKLQ